MTSHRRATRVRYHVTVTEHVDGQSTTIMDAWAAGSTPSSATSTPPDASKPNTAKEAHPTYANTSPTSSPTTRPEPANSIRSPLPPMAEARGFSGVI
jgi:hypothetical protein